MAAKAARSWLLTTHLVGLVPVQPEKEPQVQQRQEHDGQTTQNALKRGGGRKDHKVITGRG